MSWALLIVFPNDPFLRYMPTRSTSFLPIDSGDILTRCSRIRNLATIDREWGFILVFMRRGRISAPNTPTTSTLDNCSREEDNLGQAQHEANFSELIHGKVYSAQAQPRPGLCYAVEIK